MRRSLLALTWLAAGCTSSGGSVGATTPAPEVRAPQSSLTPEPGRPVPLPTRLEADRFFVTPVTEDGHELSLFTDTGGGLLLTREAAARAGLAVVTIEGDEGPTEAALLPALAWDAWIPRVEVFDGRLPVVDASKLAFLGASADGLLGQAWFKDRVWTFDYEAGALLLRAERDLPKHEPASRVPLGFKSDEAGKRLTNYPRIDVKIAGATLPLLLDTGATTNLTPAALAALGDGQPAVRATSFISATTFDAWRASQPSWRVIEGADAIGGGEPMIEVPAVEIAGHSVGPVWFTRRADANFHDWMSRLTDVKIDGALGGNALRFFRVTVDYPRKLAVFERITGR